MIALDPQEVKTLAKGFNDLCKNHFKPHKKDDIEEHARQLGITIQAVQAFLDVLNAEALEIGLTFENIEIGNNILQ